MRIHSLARYTSQVLINQARKVALACLLSSPAFAQNPSFGSLASFPAQRSTLAVAVADFDGDGAQDIAVANAASGNISIYLGSGTGTFTAAAPASLPSVICQAAYVTTGQFTKGPGPDLLAICPLGGVVVIPNKGHGTFGMPISTSLPRPAWVGNLLFGDIHPAVADFNHDGNLDLAVQTFDLDNETGNWFLLLGKGDGTFQPPAQLNFQGVVPLSIAAGDFNGDGKPDLVALAADLSANLFLEFAAGNGDGTFALPTNSTVPQSAGTILLTADMNSDGKLDVAIAGSALVQNFLSLAQGQSLGSSGVTVFLGDGKGAFKMAFNSTESVYVSGAVLANFIGTGNLDLVESTIQGDFLRGGLPSGALQIRPGNGDGTFAAPVSITFPSTTVPTDVAAADFNGDGRPDLALSSLPAHGVVLTGAALDGSLTSFLEAVLQQLPSGNANVLLNQTTAPATFSMSNGASFAAGTVANGSIVSAFGSGLAGVTLSAPSVPLPTNLGGVTVTVKDATGASFLAPLFYVSPGQINFAVPDGAAPGKATVTISSGSKVFTASQQIGPVAPGLFSAGGFAVGYAEALVNGVQQVSALTDSNGHLVPIDVSGGGTYLVLFGTGVHNHSTAATVNVGATQSAAVFAGPQGVYVGEDQINVQLPSSLQGAGVVQVSLLVDGKASNSVQILIK